MNKSELNLVKPVNKKEVIGQEIVEFKKAVAKTFKVEVSAKIYDALDLMIELHLDQKDRPDGRPYISHPLEVAFDLIQRYGITDSDLIIAGLLHDSVEDQGVKIQSKRLQRLRNADLIGPSPQHDALLEIGELFGEKVKKIVAKLTHPDFKAMIEEFESHGVKKSKHELYKEGIKKEIKDADVFVIKFADFARNALEIGKLADGPQKEKFKDKYGPVIREVFLPAFKVMKKDHPLYQKKKELIAKLEDALIKYY